MAQKTSPVHKYFNEDGENSICKECEKVIQTHHATNLRQHLKRKHLNTSYAQLEKDDAELAKRQKLSEKKFKQITIEKALKTTVEVEISYDELMDYCLEICTENGGSFKFMEFSGFQKIINKFLKKLPGNHAINRRNVVDEINKRAQELKDKVKNEVEGKMLSLKLDATSCHLRSFVGLNIQFVTDDEIPKIRIYTLEVMEMFERQTAENLRDVIIEVLKKFDIDPKQVYTSTTDNGENMIKCTKILKKVAQMMNDQAKNTDNEQDRAGQSSSENIHVSDESDSDDSGDSDKSGDSDFDDDDSDYDEENNSEEDSDEERDRNEIDSEMNELRVVSNQEKLETATKDLAVLIGIRCMSHVQQLGIKDFFKSKKEIIKKVKKISKFLRNKNIQILVKKRYKLKKPVISNVTRWNSTYKMLERILEYQTFCEENKHSHSKLNLTQNEWQEIGDLKQTLEPAYLASKHLQYEQLTLSDSFKIWAKCLTKVKKLKTKSGDDLAKCLEKRQRILFKNEAMISSLYLDPRFQYVLPEEQKEAAIDHLVKLWFHIRDLTKRATTSETPETTNTLTSEVQEEQTDDVEEEKSLDSDEECAEELMMSAGVEEQDPSDHEDNEERNRIKTLLKEFGSITREKNWKINILQFWKNRGGDLATLALVVLGVPSSQVSVERVFSHLKFILNPKRTKMRPEVLNNVLFTRLNRKYLK